VCVCARARVWYERVSVSVCVCVCVCIPEAGAQIERAASLATNRRKMRDQLLLKESSSDSSVRVSSLVSSLVQGKGSGRSFVNIFDDKLKESSDAVQSMTLDGKARDKLPYNKAMKTSDTQSYQNNGTVDNTENTESCDKVIKEGDTQSRVVKMCDMQSYNNNDKGDTRAYNEGIKTGDAQACNQRQETFDDKGSSSGPARRGQQGRGSLVSSLVQGKSSGRRLVSSLVQEKGSGRNFERAHAGRIGPVEGNEEIGVEQSSLVQGNNSSGRRLVSSMVEGNEEIGLEQILNIQQYHLHQLMMLIERDITSMTPPPAAPRQEEEEEEEEEEEKEGEEEEEEEEEGGSGQPRPPCKHEIARQFRGPLADTPRKLGQEHILVSEHILVREHSLEREHSEQSVVRGPLADTPQRFRSDQEEAHGGGGEGGGGGEEAEALLTHTPLYARAPAGRALMCL